MVYSQSLVIPDNTLVRTALILAEQGLPCFPCLDSKSPACPGGFKAATKNLSQIEGLWKKYPGTLIGIPTGNISGFDVLDIDPRHGGDKWLNENLEFITPTRVHETRSGGKHLLFLQHEGLRSSAGKLASGVDIRADGGYIIWWPAFGFKVGHGDFLSPWPHWILAQLLNTKSDKSSHQVTLREPSSAYIKAALNNALIVVASASEGSRNDILNSQTFTLLRFVKSGELDASTVCRIMAEAALAAGLNRKEIVSTLTSALRARGIT
jgi:hypothetical protein